MSRESVATYLIILVLLLCHANLLRNHPAQQNLPQSDESNLMGENINPAQPELW